MMHEDDPRVKALRDLAWGLQNRKNKPGSRIPEQYAKEAGRLSTKAVTMCSDVEYMAEEDFVARAAELTPLIHAKIKELGEVEEAEKAKLVGKCYRPASGGGYQIAHRQNVPRVGATCTTGELPTTVIDSGPAISTQEIVDRCSDDPQSLWLCDVGIKDSDMKAVCDGLRRAGGELTSIDLSQNAIADTGIQTLVTALAGGVCPKLSQLWIGGNEFGDLGVQMIKGGLCTLRRSLVANIDDADARVALVAAPLAREATSESPQAVNVAALIEPQTSLRQDLSPKGSENATCLGEVSDSAEISARRGPLKQGASAVVADPVVVTAIPQSTAVGSNVGATVSVDLFESSGSDDSCSQCVRVVVALPDAITSARDLDLDLSARRVLLRLCTDRSVVADAELPCSVDPNSAEAVFSKRKRSMTVTLRALSMEKDICE